MNNPTLRCVTPLDLPFVRRMYAQRLPLDMAAGLAREGNGMEDALWSSVPLTDLGAPTVVLRQGDAGYVGQFRLRSDRAAAHLTFLAPEPRTDDVQPWLRLLEFMTVEAGKRGAHSLSAEVPEDHAAFLAMRRAGFAVYARQVILKREPGLPVPGDASLLRPVVDQDSIALNLLYTNTVPRLLQQAEPMPRPEAGGLVYERDGQMAGYLAICEGKSGVVIKPYFHPEAYDQAAEIICSALHLIPAARQVPVYLYARSYQDWLRGALEQTGFLTSTQQALMVKYTLVRAGRVESARPALETSRLRTPVADGPMPLHKPASHKWLLRRWGRRRNGESPHEDRWTLSRRNGK